jgi:hypothetical protein
MISTSWGAPKAFTQGFNLQHVADGLYGRHLHVYDWPGGEIKQTLDLGDTGLLPLEVYILFKIICEILQISRCIFFHCYVFLYLNSVRISDPLVVCM